MIRTFLLIALALLLACSDPEARTQLTFRLDAPESLYTRVATLRVHVRSERADEREEFAAEELRWPVEIVVIPAGNNRATRPVTIEADAFARDGQRIATWQMVRAFVPKEQLAIGIAPATVNVPGDAGSQVGGGQDAQSGPADPSLDAGADTGTATRPDANGGDASSGTPTCQTPGSGIQCDDGNACNGSERCEPTNAAADARGCVEGDDAVVCSGSTTCDAMTGKCSTCQNMPDGDGDGAKSRACGGTDCDDSDKTSAPGLADLCDGKDNDCDTIVDGPAANLGCASVAPRGGSATCENGRCAQRCDNPSHQIEGGICVPPPGTCPIINPCAPGVCIGGRGSYACMCPSGYRSGLTRCAPSGVRRRTIGFESTCDGMPTPGMFMAGVKQVPASLYAACGVASVTSAGLTGEAQLFAPPAATVEGLTGEAALGGGASMSASTIELSLSFSPAVNELAFDLLDLDNASGLRVLLAATDGLTLLDAKPEPAADTKRVRVAHSASTPVARATISYVPRNPGDIVYLDELSIDVWGCGDGEFESGAGETCDDGNAIQCDGCDNACVASSAGCLDANACIANGTVNGCTICDLSQRTDAGVDVVPSRDPRAGASCQP